MARAFRFSNWLMKLPSSRTPAAGWRRRGSALAEAALALSMLLVLSLVMMRGSLNALSGRQWTIMQNLSDAYMTFEVARAERVPFEDFLDENSPWPQSPDTADEVVEIGRTMGGVVITATVTRTRVPDEGNLPEAGGTGTPETNPARMEAYRLQSHLTYNVGSRSYVKSRTVVRSR